VRWIPANMPIGIAPPMCLVLGYQVNNLQPAALGGGLKPPRTSISTPFNIGDYDGARAGEG